MNLDRLEVLAMIGFIKHVIPENGDESYLFVKVENDTVICIGGTGSIAKKVVLVKHPDIEKRKNVIPGTFMIPKSSLLGFETIMNKHKKLCKKLAKSDPNYLFVDVTENRLESHGVDIIFPKPSRDFEDMEHLFQKNKAPITDMIILSCEIEDIMKGFKKSKQVKATFSGKGETVHFSQDSTGYEAFFIPPVEEEPPLMTGSNNLNCALWGIGGRVHDHLEARDCHPHDLPILP